MFLIHNIFSHTTFTLTEFQSFSPLPIPLPKPATPPSNLPSPSTFSPQPSSLHLHNLSSTEIQSFKQPTTTKPHFPPQPKNQLFITEPSSNCQRNLQQRLIAVKGEEKKFQQKGKIEAGEEGTHRERSFVHHLQSQHGRSR